MYRPRLGMIGFAVLFAVAGTGPLPSPAQAPSREAAVRSAADGFSGVSDEPRMGDLASVRVESGTESSVEVPTFELRGPAAASRSPSSDGTVTSTTRSGTPSSGKESTRISGSGSFSSSQGQGGSSGRSSGNTSSGSGGSNGGNSDPDPDQICSMPAMC